MNDVNRRDAVKLAAGLIVGAGALAAAEARGEAPQKTAEPQPVGDTLLNMAQHSPQAFMFAEAITFKIEGDGFSRDLWITSARGLDGKATQVRVPSYSMRVFQADPDRDDFTRQGGFYWKFHKMEGKAQFKEPGALVMIVRENYDTIRCYSLVLDARC